MEENERVVHDVIEDETGIYTREILLFANPVDYETAFFRYYPKM